MEVSRQEMHECMNMTVSQIRGLYITDFEKYRKYRKLFDQYYRFLISPLFTQANKLGEFEFQTPFDEQTIAKLFKEICDFFELYGIIPSQETITEKLVAHRR